MIDLIKICEFVERQISTSEHKYKIYSDAELHKKATRNGNIISNFIEGVGTIISSSVVPNNGITFGTQVVGFELAIPIDHKEMTEDGIENIVDSYKQDINEFVSTPGNYNFGNNNLMATYTGTLPEVGEVQSQPSLGTMIPITFTITFNYFYGGVNSTQEILKYVNGNSKEDIVFLSLTIGRNVIQDAGAFSGTDGIAKNYVQTTALSIELVIPALSLSNFCKRFYNFLRTGENDPFKITYRNSAYSGATDEKEYNVIFLSSNSQAQGLDNVGYTITLAEALEV